MNVLGDVIARDRRSDRPALSVPAVGRRYDYRRFCTTAWKVGHFLGHLGVRGGVGVAIADDPLPEPILTLYGAASLGAVVRFGPPADIDADTRALVVGVEDVEDYAVGPSTKRVVYGDPPDDPSISYFERDVWSENPTEPPDTVDPNDPLLWTADGGVSHREALEAAWAVVLEYTLDEASHVAVRGSFADPTVVVGGLIAPLVAGAALSIATGREREGGGDADLVVGGPESDLDTIEFEQVE